MMKPEPVSTKKFQKAFATTKARTAMALQACTIRPTPEAIHEARIAIRKLTTIVSLMPRGFRRDGRTVETARALRLFYNDCARIRDVDAMLKTLSTGTVFGDLTKVMGDLRKRRSALSARVLESRDKMSRLAFPKPMDVNRRGLSKRLDKLLTKRAGRASELYRIVSRRQEKVVELHKLRKECRHLMYLLDYAKENPIIKSARLDFENAREKLGSIRDDDVLLDLLRGTTASASVANAYAVVSAGRSSKYRKFFSDQMVRGKTPRLVESVLSLT